MGSHQTDGEPSGTRHSDEYSPASTSHGRFRFKTSSARSSKRRDHHEEDPLRTLKSDRKRPRTSDSRSSQHTANSNTTGSSHPDETSPVEENRTRSSHRRHRHKRHRSRSREHKRRDSSKNKNKDDISSAHPPLSPNAAFRESLFDALGDDEGAAYWETVYGQPIHNFAVPEVPRGPDGELEQMTDEEYATYVRSRMWERTREGMLEEQDRLREERCKARQRARNSGGSEERRREQAEFERAMEESLRRGAERKMRKKNWEGVWGQYLGRWEDIARVVEKAASTRSTSPSKEAEPSAKVGHETPRLRNLLFWPVESGKRRDVNADSVRDFLRHSTTGDLMSTLKAERVRWHPDKIQHRYSVLGIEEEVMKSVTEVFQIIDRMWSEERQRG
ncbi:hypothetical protein POX_e07242 [Penicillium oxalicum]|uniref:hypothetical protein n=1 Tax=Penicillium oxalicum TaxID=69781 RepID=UPI0020B8B9FF|nr:hypothetical protein POX_e07242 [Penicillium oxalicum]KAI2789212.1 hypothetical protein POX_e07242 [Penicillium oxalicum]